MNATPIRPAVLLVESSRATAFTDSLLSRDDVDVVLLRCDSAALSADYLQRTAHVPTFTLDSTQPLLEEAARYLRWMKGTRNLPRPRMVCALPEARQTDTRRFAALVDLPHLTGQQVTWMHGRMTQQTPTTPALAHAA
ncbi:hypothetical protein [Streptomyces sp. SAS_270]|uniref:hypothetical protein n=1 Tax=Streptomyces sp. SAS_270 TaxID=3412748 RepID=UPI00403D5103